MKTGNECVQEGAYCQLLGADVCPEVYGFHATGYFMEKLYPIDVHEHLLLDIEDLLDERVWCRPALPSSSDLDWREQLHAQGIAIPNGIHSTLCMVHGDPTVSNALSSAEGDLLLCDPRPPRSYVPQYIETDMAVLLQSYYGWEHAAYGWDKTVFVPPRFTDNPTQLRRAMFWLGVKARRIATYEQRGLRRPQVFAWCEEIRSLTHV